MSRHETPPCVTQWLTERRFTATTCTTYRAVLVEFDRRFPNVLPRPTTEQLWSFLTTTPDGSPRAQAPNTLKRYWIATRSFTSWALERGLNEDDPGASLKKPRMSASRVRHGRWLTAIEA